MVTYYGVPGVPRMGILGELNKTELVRQLKRQAAQYERPDDKPVQGAIHLIAAVAQNAPGNDGLYLLRTSAKVIEEYAQLAEENDLLLILDLQIGRSNVPDEIEAVRPYLERPYVHLALDPEFDMPPGQVPGQKLGTMTASDINHAIGVLSEIAQTHNLPNKVLIVHQFEHIMIENKQAIRNDPRVDFVLDMDGFGGRKAKLELYELFVHDEPLEYGGIKLFYQQDTDLLTPDEVLGLKPPPAVIVYQ